MAVLTVLPTTAPEEGTYVITMVPTDEDGVAVTPNSATWDLTDGSGSIVNSRSSQSIASPSTRMTVVLSSDDLSLSGYAGTKRRFTMRYTYNSTLGTSMPNNAEAEFDIKNLLNIS